MTSGGEGFPGAALAAAREALDISVNDVAESLNLPNEVIEGIESGEYEGLPPVTFTRGYVRAYAKLLDLDADELVSQFDATADLSNESELVVAQTRRGIVDVSQGDPGRVMSAAVVVVLIAAAIVLWWVWPDPEQADETNVATQAQPATPAAASAPKPSAVPATDVDAAMPPAPEPTVTEPPAAAPIAPASTPAETNEPGAVATVEAERLEGESQTEAAASNAVAARDASSPRVEVQPASRLVEAEPAAAIAVNAMTGTESVNAGHLLTFSFSDDCWVEVQDRNGRSIYSDLNRPGQLLELTGEAPFRILLGYAPGVHLEYNGEPVALTPHTRNNVAQLVLGQ